MASFERHQSKGAHRFVFVTDDSETPLKGYSEKIVLCNYRDLCPLQFQEVHCYPGALGAEESTEEKCNVVFGWRAYHHTHEVNKVSGFDVWLGENKATPPLAEAETVGRASPRRITAASRKTPSELGSIDHILVHFHRAERSSSLSEALSLPGLLISSAHYAVCLQQFSRFECINDSVLRSHLGVGCPEQTSTAINRKSPSHSPEFPQCCIMLNLSFK